MRILERLGGLSRGAQRALLLVACVVLFGFWPRWVPLVEVDETRYAEATREMLESRDFIVPQYNYAPRYQKPILFYWLQCASVTLLGPGETAARAPSALLGTALVFLVYAFLLRWLPRIAGETEGVKQSGAAGAALLGAGAVATTPLVVIWARAGVTDMTLTFFITATLLALLQAALHPNRARVWYLLAAPLAGLAFLTKGPLGVVVPAAVWLAYHLREGSLRQEWRRVPWVLAIPAFLITAAPWYVAVTLADGPTFVKRFFLVENLERFAGVGTFHGGGIGRRLSGLLGYVGLAILLLFPYNAFALREALAPRIEGSATAARVRRFACVWVGMIFLLFTPAHHRYPNYVQSAAGGIAILFALHALGRLSRPAGEGDRRGHPNRWLSVVEPFLLMITGAAWVGVSVALLARGSAGRRPWDQSFPVLESAVAGVLVTLLGAVLASVMLLAYRRRKPAHLLFGVAGTWSLLLGAILFSIAPMYARSSYAPAVRVGELLRRLPRTEPVLAYFPRPPENLVYYGRRRVELIDSNSPRSVELVRRALAAGGRVVLVTDDSGLALLEPLGRVDVIRHFDYFIVARLTGSPP